MKKTKTIKEESVLDEKVVNKLLSLMGTKAKAKVSFDKENEAINVDIDAREETGLLIGRHGDTLNSLQTILSLMVKNKAGDWKRVIVNVGDWREKQEEYLNSMAEETAKRAVETGEEQPLYNLTPSQRRIIHLALSENPKVETESLGEGEGRYLIVKPKKK